MPLIMSEAVSWYLAPSPHVATAKKELCPTRDVFQARLDTFYREMVALKILIEDEAALLAAVCGEIGNNCFDHNLGQWSDSVGCWFSYQDDLNHNAVLVTVADRGQGLLNSLKRVQLDLQTEEEAIQIAFKRKISGRSPEKRGNGLKFVRSVINGSDKRGLLFYSGRVKIELGGLPLLEQGPLGDSLASKQGTGTLAFMVWKKL